MLAVRQAPARDLSVLLAGLTPDVVPPVSISSVALDSRRVSHGALFMATPGASQHGLAFLDEAIDRGAVAVAWDGGTAPDCELPAFRVPDLAAHAGTIASRFYGEPSASLFTVGVTGTDGKTSCAFLLAQALADLGQRCGYIGTLGYGEPGQLEAGTHTTPDPVSLQQWLARLVDDECRAVALEVSSHALAQSRVAGTAFDVAVLTNIGRDHLDYHGSLAAYAAAKQRLFSMPGLGYAVLNTDDPQGAQWAAEPPAGVEVVAYGLHADVAQAGHRHVRALEVLTQPHGLVLDVDGSWGRLRLESRLIGRFNAYNLLAALAVLLVRGVPAVAAVRALSRLAAVPGRMDVVATPPGRPLVVVDYAHTPGALEQALSALCEHTNGRVHCVFGCGGERDPGKRPLMGAVAARYADAVWITDDNPRSEDPAAITAAIVDGVPGEAAATMVHDRAAAIAQAIGAAGSSDAVLIAGKGHETTQVVGGERRHFDDREAARAVVEAA